VLSFVTCVLESRLTALACGTLDEMGAAEPMGVRARARAELLDDVGKVARAQLAEVGAADLSVRAIARELGLASSALYRYYPSRDALLTRLIIESYDSLGASVEEAEAAIPREDRAGRFLAICHGVRNWARAHPHEYALIYGSPVPGYAAPDDTIDPAIRVPLLLIALAADIDPSGLRHHTEMPVELDAQLVNLAEQAGRHVDPHVLALGVGLWAQVFGMVSFELFGTFHNAFDDADAIFEHQLGLGLAAFGLD